MIDTTTLHKPLSIDEIDFRIQSIFPNGWAILLAYKDARVDMNRLNSVFGVGGWQRRHEIINGNLYCSVGVWNKDINQWCWVQDVGTESNTEKQKGQASDSFKRACFNLGIGIELYDYPSIFVKLNDDEYEKTAGKPKQTNKLKLKQWKWHSQFDGPKLVVLLAKDHNGTRRFTFDERKETTCSQ